VCWCKSGVSLIQYFFLYCPRLSVKYKTLNQTRCRTCYLLAFRRAEWKRSVTKHPASNSAAIFFLPLQQWVLWLCEVGNTYVSMAPLCTYFFTKYCFASYHAFSFENHSSFLLVLSLSLSVCLLVISTVGFICLNFKTCRYILYFVLHMILFFISCLWYTFQSYACFL
jgi:hypothetical protein